MPNPYTQTPPGNYFTRTGSRQKVSVLFPISSAALDDVKARYTYDFTSAAWESTSPTSISSRLLVSTREELNLDGSAFDSSAPGTQSQGKVWKAVRLVTPSSIVREPPDPPTGSPAVLTRYSIPVPSWVNKFIFAHSVYEAIADNNTMYLGVGTPDAGDIISFISPSGRTIPCAALAALLAASEPPVRESGVRPLP